MQLDLAELGGHDAARQQTLFPDLPDGGDAWGDAEPVDVDVPTPAQAEGIVRQVLGLPDSGTGGR